LQEKEIRREARDLEEDGDEEPTDALHTLRKLLRNFSDLMAANSLEGSEDCGICMESLQVDRSVSFPCQHIVCEDCFKQLQPNEEAVTCPHCRKQCGRDDIEKVVYTASTQWDELLDIANAFAKIDRRRTEDTSEEEAEQDFLDDNPSETTAEPSHHEPEQPNESSPEQQDPSSDEADPLPASDQLPALARKRRVVESSGASSGAEDGSEVVPIAGPSMGTDASRRTPESSKGPSFAESPTTEKRRRLQQLAELRENKRRRY